MTTQTTKISAKRKLEISQLTPKAVQLELMGIDVDVNKFELYLARQTKTDLTDRIIDATVSRTMTGSSTLTVIINDYDRALLNSGQLYNKLDVEVDGLWFRLMGVDKNDNELTLTFEDREVAILRTYKKWKIARSSKVTRAQFVLNLIREVKEFNIPVVIPELKIIQNVERYPGDIVGIDNVIQKGKGIPADLYKTPPDDTKVTTSHKWSLFVKKAPATREQVINANIIIGVGDYLGVSRKLQVVAVMAAIVESRLINNPGGDGTSAGLFQQVDNGHWGSYLERIDPETSAGMFYRDAIKADAAYPKLSYNDLAQMVQGSKFPDAYGQYRDEAERLVSAYGTPGGDNEIGGALANGSVPNVGAGGDFFFYRGALSSRAGVPVRKPENSWSCIQRLADEVDWRAFFVGGVFYFISEDALIKQQPIATITEFMQGITAVDGNFYQHKKSATLTISATVGRWFAPPGSVVVVQEMGPWNGRWLVLDYERSLYDLNATITLIKERPSLPEPVTGNAQDIDPSWIAQPTGGGIGTPLSSNPQISNRPLALLATELLTLQDNGWTDGNGRGYDQLWRTSRGQKINSAIGPVDLDPRLLELILWLIKEKGYKIGTTAWASAADHDNDGPTGHSGGFAVDIGIINGVPVNVYTPACRELVFNLDKVLNSINGVLAPRQIISGGYGNVRDFGISALSRPGADAYYNTNGVDVMAQHTNHIHVGY